MKNRITIEFRQKQLFLDNDPLQPVIIDCSGPIAQYLPGTVPNPNWVDMTENVEGLDKLKMSWSASNPDSESDANSTNEFGSNYQKGLSADLRFYGVAYQFIYDWLLQTPCQAFNCVEVRLTDNDCQKEYRIFEIKVDNVKYKPNDEPCIVSMPLREADATIHSFQKTPIEDNWQDWFNQYGTSAKDHPTFGIVVEKKPKLILAFYVAMIYIVGMLSIGILIALTEGKKWISRSLGFTYFCPAPLIRTYIQNICDKYGYTFNTIFDDNPANPYRDLCFFWPSGVTYKEFQGGNYVSPSTKFIWENRSDLPFVKFLNQLKKVFNAEWYVTPNNELIFQNKAFWDNQAPLYDFTAPGATPIYNLEYDFNGKKKPAYGNYQYFIDPQDTCSNELKWRYNDIVDYDGPANNPMLEGNATKSFDFAMTSFHNDGSSRDFLQEGIELGRLIASGAVLLGLIDLLAGTGGLTVFIAIGLVSTGYLITNNYINDYFDNANLNGMVRLSSSEINMPRLLLWDRDTGISTAKVVSVENPTVNPRYNTAPVDYYTEHASTDGSGTFGGDVTKVYNYPMYVDAMFTDNLFDRFHEHDNPLFNPVINQTFDLDIDMCCEWLERLGVFQNDFAKIGAVLTLENRNGRLIKGRITNFEPDYDTGNIHIKGDVLK
jgi:hypothetical protein